MSAAYAVVIDGRRHAMRWASFQSIDDAQDAVRKLNGVGMAARISSNSPRKDMVYEPKTNSGALFREKEKKSEASPDMHGRLDVDGRKYELSGWTKTSKAGVKFLSLAVKPARESAVAPAVPKPPSDKR